MGKIYTKDNTQIGEIIYHIENWTNFIVKSKVTEIMEAGCRTKDLFYVDKNGIEIDKTFGESGAPFSGMYQTAKEAYDAREASHLAAIDKYCEEIQTLEDLIRFPLDHCLNGEEYTNWDANKAYQIRANELLNCNLFETGPSRS